MGDVTRRPINIIRRNARVRVEATPWVSITALGFNRLSIDIPITNQHNRGKPDMSSYQQDREQGACAALAQAVGA